MEGYQGERGGQGRVGETPLTVPVFTYECQGIPGKYRCACCLSQELWYLTSFLFSFRLSF